MSFYKALDSNGFLKKKKRSNRKIAMTTNKVSQKRSLSCLMFKEEGMVRVHRSTDFFFQKIIFTGKKKVCDSLKITIESKVKVSCTTPIETG